MKYNIMLILEDICMDGNLRNAIFGLIVNIYLLLMLCITQQLSLN